MKKNTKRRLALLLSVLTVASVLLAVIPAAAASDVSIQNGTGNREPIRVGKTYSYRAIVNGEFSGFGISMPTWTKTDSYATLYVYKWEGSYEATLDAAPIASKTFDPPFYFAIL